MKTYTHLKMKQKNIEKNRNKNEKKKRKTKKKVMSDKLVEIKYRDITKKANVWSYQNVPPLHIVNFKNKKNKLDLI